MTEDIEIHIRVTQVDDNDDEIIISTNLRPEELNYWLDKAKFMIISGAVTASDGEENAND